MGRPVYILLAWLIVNLLQAAFTPLDADETYYWMYAHQLDWGYFDHPPAVALLVSLGKDWLPGSLGLRFGHVLAGTVTLVALYHLLDRPRAKLFWLAAALVCAQPMLNVYGFIATPDAPLLLFTVLYLLAYKRFLKTPDLLSGALWGLTMAGLLYSKYHGVMLILFSVLPNLLWLLRKPGAWLAALGGAALFFPHLYWQYANDYPSFRYHLSGRDDAYQFKYTTEYVLNQLLIFSPLLVYYYVKTFVKDHPVDNFSRACRWLVVGFLGFFLYTTTKGGTEAQWTALLSIPLVYLTYTAVRDRFPEWRSGILKMAVATIVILTVARLLIAAPRAWLPFEKPFDHAPWVERLAERAGGLPVMVENSYRLASLYEFYSGGKPAWTFTDVAYRLNQYDLWNSDTIFHNQQVLVLGQGNWSEEGTEPFRTQKRDMRTKVIDNFQVAKRVKLEMETLPNEEIILYASWAGPRVLRLDAELPLQPFAILNYANGEQRFWQLGERVTDILLPGERAIVYRGPLGEPQDPATGEATLEFGLGYRGMPPLRGMSPPLQRE